MSYCYLKRRLQLFIRFAFSTALWEDIISCWDENTYINCMYLLALSSRNLLLSEI
jgi:hypothetical protein